MSAELLIEEILHEELLSCSPATSVVEAARRMQQAACGSILVVEGGEPLGIWTERDVLGLDFSSPDVARTPIARVMSAPVRSVSKKSSVSEAGRLFRRERIRHLLVTNERDEAVGIVSQTDVVLSYGVDRYLYLRAVREALKGQLVTLPEREPCVSAATEMFNAGVDAAVVQDSQGRPLGILTERDLVRALAEERGLCEAGDLATRPLLTVGEDTPLLRARDLSLKRGIRHLGVKNGQGEVVGVLSFADILGLVEHEYVHQLEQALEERDQALIESQRSLRMAKKVIDASTDGILVTDADGVIEMVNPAFTRLTGYLPEEVVGNRPSILKSGRQDQAFYQTLWQAIRSEGYWQGEIWNRRKNGEVFPEWLTISAIRDEVGGERKYAGIFNDITARKQAEEHIRNLAYYDILTGLPNRRLFSDRLSLAMAQAKRHGQPLALLFIDLDLFKRINDTLGHSAGDYILEEMARRLKLCVREGDTVSRMGGDEFTIIAPDLDSEDVAARMATRILENLKAPFLFEERELYVTGSIGIAIYPNDGDNEEILIKNADTAMYRAKDLGRNSYQLYTASMNAKSFERLTLEAEMRKALERGEFHLNYQVKVDLIQGAMTGAEALIRWQHPNLGLVPPAQFIGLAEDTGLILPIGEWVLQEACRQNAIWQQAGLPPIRISVNLSQQQLRQGDVVTAVEQALADSGLASQYLELELTESMLMERVDQVADQLDRLRAMGVSISVDDFGTGYSSLAYLRRLPIDVLKIDRSFVRDVGEDRDDEEIVAAIIAMAHQLNLSVIAEGVETPAQVAYLRKTQCDEIQGFLVSRPMSAENFESLFSRHLLPGD